MGVFLVGERTHCVSVRLSAEELRALDRRRGKIRRGTYLRNLFLRKKEPQQIPEANKEQYMETARWASNLNQIARAANIGGAITDLQELRQLLAGFRRCLIGLTGEEGAEDDSQNL